MNRLFLTVLFFLNATICFSQNWKDTLLLKMPMVEGRLVYGDSIKINGKNKTSLDSIAKKWFETYFKYHRPDTLSKDNDANCCILSQGAVEFKISTSSLALVKYDFFLIMTVKVDCYYGYYRYKYFDIFFTPKSSLFRAVGYYQTSPEYLIGLLKKKHLGLGPSINMGRKKILEYLTCTNDAIEASIASLNKAMAN